MNENFVASVCATIMGVSILIALTIPPAHCAPLPTAEVKQDGTATVVIPSVEVNGERKRAELTLKPDKTYSYTVESWGCAFGPYYDEKTEACK